MPTTSQRDWRSLALIFLAVVLVLVLWQQVFMMTGLLWWNAPQATVRVSPPRPLATGQLDTSWVDLGAFLGTHPEWEPR